MEPTFQKFDLLGKLDLPLEKILEEAMIFIQSSPGGWKNAGVKIVLGGREYKNERYRETARKREKEIIVGGERKGHIEIHCEEKELEETEPFSGRLQKERIEDLTRQLECIIEFKETEERLGRLKPRIGLHGQNLDAILSVSPDLILLIDGEGRCAYANPAAARALGEEQADILSKTWGGLNVPEELAGRFDRQRQEVFARKKFVRDEAVLPRPEAGEWYEYVMSPILQPDGRVEGVFFTARNIGANKKIIDRLKESEEEARRLARENALIAEIGRIISSNLEIGEIYERFAEEAKKLISFDRITIFRINPDRKTASVRYVHGLPIPERQPGDVFPIEGSLAGTVMLSRHPVLLNLGNEETANQIPGAPLLLRAGLRSSIYIPLIEKDQSMGCLAFLSTRPDAYGETDLRLAQAIGFQIAGAVANAALFSGKKEMEDALRESEDKFRRLAEDATIGIALIQDDLYRYINPKFAEIFGYSVGEIVDKKGPKDLYAPESLPVYTENMQKRISGESSSVHYEAKGRRKNSEIFDAEIYGSRTLYNHKFAIIGTLADITERKKMEREIEFLSSFPRLIPDPILEVDALGEISFYNQAAARTMEKLRIPWDMKAFLPADLEEMLHDLKEGRENHYSRELKIGDSTFEEMIYVTAQFKTLRIHAHDITIRKKAQEELLRAHRQFQDIIEFLPDPTFVADNRKKVIAWNQALEKMTGVGKEAMIGKSDYARAFYGESRLILIDLLFGEDAKKIEKRYSSMEMEEKRVQGEVFLPSAYSGKGAFVLGTASLLFDNEGRQMGAIQSVRDVTEQKKTNVRLLQSEKMASIGQLAAGVAHEINNPTGFVSSNLKTLADYCVDFQDLIGRYQELLKELKETDGGAGGDPQILAKVGEIESQEKKADVGFLLEDTPHLISESQEGMERIKKIVQDLKDFAHPGEDQLKPADLNKNLDSTLNVVWNELKYKAAVKKEYGELPEVQCYPQQLNQVFMNILVNAAQAIKEKGEIRIATHAEGGFAVVQISDTVCGIPAENLPRIFDPFFTTKEVGKGTGLGLNVAYNIVKKHNGTIDVKSEVGKGTTFTVRIPLNL